MRLWVGNEHWISKSVIFSLSLGTADDYLFMDAPGRLEVFCHFHTAPHYELFQLDLEEPWQVYLRIGKH